MADATVAFDGWNSVVGWGEQTWGNGASFVSATGSVNSVVVEIGRVVTGVSATGSVHSVLIWTKSQNVYTPVWNANSGAQTPTWSENTSTQSPVWTKLAA